MDLNKKQDALFEATGLIEAEKTSIAAVESMGASHAFAKVTERIETVNLMLVPAMSSTGMLAGEIKNLYEGKGEDSEAILSNLAEVLKSVAIIGKLCNIPLEKIAELAFQEKE